MNEQTTCAFTGHRDVKDDLDINFFEQCLQEVINKGYDTFLCGMARGFDLIAGGLVLKLKETNPQIKLIACVPCPDQEKYYSPAEKEKYEKVLDGCDEVKLLSEKFYKGCMLRRDRYMVDNCSLVFAYGRKDEGGTYYTLTYAVSKNKKVMVI